MGLLSALRRIQTQESFCGVNALWSAAGFGAASPLIFGMESYKPGGVVLGAMCGAAVGWIWGRLMWKLWYCTIVEARKQSESMRHQQQQSKSDDS
jgi:hypothetical protein